ncbi:MAG: hypothetical protein MK212_00215 [Saprospiraceae bacterium]|nr:hypothetical protein [Saprospiraceae bacterium]
MKSLFISIIVSNFVCPSFGQSTPPSESPTQNHYVFRVKKAVSPIVAIETKTLDSVSYQDQPKNLGKLESHPEKLNDSSDLSGLPSKPELVERKRPKKFSRLPYLSASGNYAFMYISPHEEAKIKQLQNSNQSFVIYDFVVNVYGKVSSIGIYQTNDQAFAKELIRNLNKTEWQAALDDQGNPSTYHFGKFIATRQLKY